MIQRLNKRITFIERELAQREPEIHEIIMKGGLTPGRARHASLDSDIMIEAEPDETFPDFRERVRAVAKRQGARMISFGGLPLPPTIFADPPGQAEALARLRNESIDEIDS